MIHADEGSSLSLKISETKLHSRLHGNWRHAQNRGENPQLALRASPQITFSQKNSTPPLPLTPMGKQKEHLFRCSPFSPRRGRSPLEFQHPNLHCGNPCPVTATMLLRQSRGLSCQPHMKCASSQKCELSNLS